MSCLSESLRALERGESLWLGEMRRSFGEEKDALNAWVRVALPGGGIREYRVPVIPPESGQEAGLLREYLRAHFCNILSACSACRLTVFLPGSAELVLRTLAEEALSGLHESGYDKALRVAERLCRAAGAPSFSGAVLPLSAREPLPQTEIADCAPLGPRLRRRAEQAERGLRCGLDVGGTDIKLAIARDGQLLLTEEYDWDPSRFSRAEEMIEPILSLLRRGLDRIGPDERLQLDSLGLSFPDVVIRDRILGGETPKTRGMREHDPAGYERELAELARLKERLEALCRPGTRVRVLNDGSMAAFSAAVELACSGEDAAVEQGVFAHSLGTDLGSGWLQADGEVPELPLELYDLLIDLGSAPAAALPAEDLRSTRNENSGLPGARRYLGQAAAYRLAWEIEPELLKGFTDERSGVLRLRQEPEDLRKACLNHLMRLAEQGEPGAEAVFLRIGRHLGQISREIDFLLSPETRERFLFGRFVHSPRCFALLQKGCADVMPELRLRAADEDLAASPLMHQLAAREDGAVARFGQAVGAIYYSIREDER